MRDVPHTRFDRLGLLGLGVCTVLTALLATYVLQRELFRDENMYVTAGHLLRNGHRLYDDFAYVQMPYLPYLYASWFGLTQATEVLLWARLLTVGFMGASLLLLWSLSRTLSGHAGVALATVVLFAAHEAVLATGVATNHHAAITLALLGLWMLARVQQLSSASVTSWALIAGAGIALGLGIGVKLYDAPQAAVLLGGVWHWTVVRKISRRDRWALVATFAGGVCLGLLPAGLLLLRDPWTFWFNNVEFHRLNTQWRHSIGHVEGMEVSSKLVFMAQMSNLSGNLGLAMLALFALWKRLRGEWWGGTAPRALLVLVGALTVVSCATLFGLTPLWLYYFAVPLPYLLLLLAAVYREGRLVTGGLGIAVVTLSLAIAVWGGGKEATLAARIPSEQWGVAEVRGVAQRLRAALPPSALASAGSMKIATLSPVYAVQAGLDLYAELSTGVFMWRVGPFLSPAQRGRLHVASAESLVSLFDSVPPVAVLVGAEPKFEVALVAWAEKQGYRKVPLGSQMFAYLRHQ